MNDDMVKPLPILLSTTQMSDKRSDSIRFVSIIINIEIYTYEQVWE
jgi:hypothetical protein